MTVPSPPRLLTLFLLLALSPLYAHCEGLTRCHLTFPSGSQFIGILESEVPGKSVTIRDALGHRFGYSLTNGTKMWKEWLDVPDERSPLLSGLLSFLIPGMGQHYNGEGNLGLAIEGVCLGGLLFGSLSGFDSTPKDSSYDVGIGFFLTAYIFGIVQAPIASFLGNDQRKDVIYGRTSQVVPGVLQGNAPGLLVRLEW